MSNVRFRALESLNSRPPVKVEAPSKKISDYFGVNVFNNEAMLKFLPKNAYKAVIAAIETGEKIDRKIAGEIAHGMKEWAISQGAKHYTH